MERPLENAYITTKDILAASAAYASLRGLERINLEDFRNDILYQECVSAQRPPPNGWVTDRLANLQLLMEGTVTNIDDELFLKTDRGLVRFSLVTGGIRRLALLWLLLRSSCLSNHFVFFWDEAEATCTLY